MEDLLGEPALGKVLLHGGGPAAKLLVDGEELRVGQLAFALERRFGSRGR